MRLPLAPLICVLLLAAPARAATCGAADFNAWLGDIRNEARAKGIGQPGLAALEGVTADPAVLKADRNQGVFSQTFEQFSGRMIPPRLNGARVRMAQNVGLLQRIEVQYGVPPAVIVAIWGLETSFGAITGKFATIRSIATLAWDCRRTERFQAELFDALRLVDRGDLAPAAMRGAWAGELGQTQFMASSYMKYAVDFDGDGKRDLMKSVPDVLASTANYLKEKGWTRGAGWEAGQPNFAVLKQWNDSDIYIRTVAAFATQLSGR